jgi:hypothetical protein
LYIEARERKRESLPKINNNKKKETETERNSSTASTAIIIYKPKPI